VLGGIRTGDFGFVGGESRGLWECESLIALPHMYWPFTILPNAPQIAPPTLRSDPPVSQSAQLICSRRSCNRFRVFAQAGATRSSF
jgi:hypothetical protein